MKTSPRHGWLQLVNWLSCNYFFCCHYVPDPATGREYLLGVGDI